MGAVRFVEQLATFGHVMPLEEGRRVVNIYRDANWKINTLWRDLQQMLVKMSRGETMSLGPNGIIRSIETATGMGILLPSGLVMRYDALEFEQGERGPEFSYKTRRGRTRIYGGKLCENVCQAIARCIMGEQMLAVAKQEKVALTVHDSLVCCVLTATLDQSQAFIESCMRVTPSWAEGLPITCESDSGKSYGEAAG